MSYNKDMKKYYFTQEISEKMKSVKQLPEWLKSFPSYKEQIKIIREVLGMTQDQLGKRINLSGRNIRRIESGTLVPNISTLEKIAEVFNAEVKILILPRQDINALLEDLAEKKAREIVANVQANSVLELQGPTKKALETEVNKIKKEILAKKRNILWGK